MEGVQWAGFPGLGSGSPVFLIHADGLKRGAWGWKWRVSARPSPKTGCYHTASVNVL